MASREEADRTLAHHEASLLENANVSSISVIEDESGEIIIELGLIEPETATLVAAPEELTIPDATGTLATGAPTIAVRKRVVGEINAQSFTNRVRPANGGNSCGPVTASWSGTLGARIQFSGKPCILSNWHVLYGGKGKDKDSVVQPAVGDGGKAPKDVIGANLKGVLTEYVDAAVATIASPPDEFVVAGTRCYGPITRTATVAVGDPVKKCGRTTEATIGDVRSTNATVRVNGYPGGPRTFRDQIQTTHMSNPGDSGSIVLDADGNAVALLFAGGANDTFANKLSRVSEALGGPISF
ncbi:MAG: trypsin-like peptidase domain-containing protein [Roseibium sp.]